MHTVETIEKCLYTDRQAVKPAAFCEICGGELYFPGDVCLRCLRRRQDDAGTAEQRV